MKRTITWLLCAALTLFLQATAQNITHSFRDVSMSDALKYLQLQTDRYKIVFIYDDLEDYKVTTHVKNKPVPDAIRQIIGFYPISMRQGMVGEIYVEATHKTDHRLKGLVVDENNLPLPYANVTLLNPADSTMVGGGVTNESGRFVIPLDQPRVIARISYVGYKTVHRLCTHDNVGTIKMRPDVTPLKETVVTAAKMQIERDGANYTLRNLGGTIMGNAGNALDLLRWTPGVVVNMNEDISLIGRDGKTEIYIDNRKITDNTQLKAVTSQNVKRVEIIREPDAQYASNVASVIKLFTHNPRNDNLGSSLLNVLDIKRRVSNVTTLTIDGKQDKWSGNASLSYGRLNSKAFSNGLTTVTGENGQQMFEKTDTTGYTSRGRDFKVFAGVNYALSPTSIIGAQYSGHSYQADIEQHIFQHTNQVMWSFPQMTNQITRHSLSASYQWQPSENSQLLLIADYAASLHEDVQDIYEFISTKESPYVDASTIIKSYSIMNTNDYDIVTATARYNFVSREWDNKTGIEWGYTGSTGIVRRNQVTQTSKRDNDWLGLYYSLSKTWGQWRANAGLRYEYDHTWTQRGDDHLNKTYHNLLPSASIGFQLRPDIDFTLYYRRTLRRPTYSELRPTSYYVNSYEESSGNPLLQPTVTDRWTLNAIFKGFTASVAYSIMDNAIQRIVEYMPSGVIREYPINIKHSHAWSLDLGYNYVNPWLNLGVHSSAMLPHVTYPYLDEMRTEGKPFATLAVNAQFTVAKRYMLGCNMLYCSPWTAGFSRNGSMMGINLSAMTTLCKGRLLLGLTANDIFRRSMAPWSKMRYMNVYHELHNSYDSRGISLMARWTFNTISNPFKRHSGNDATLQRTQEN
ncbi:MAG: TonB-dependent receptor [Muribaculaceae bacterium]|nr:TonB-dependent receptor [Muribaculaceae bacterium]